MSKRVRSRGYCFSLHNWSDNDLAYLMDWCESDKLIKYMIIGFEKGVRGDSPHLQGYVYFGNPLGLDPVKAEFKSMNQAFHIEPQNARLNVNAYCYCMDDSDYWEFGDRPRQGHRTDLEVIKHDLESGKPMNVVAKEYFSQWCQYRRAFNEYVALNCKTGYDTKLMAYDKSRCIHQFKYIRQNFKDFHIVTHVQSCMEIALLVSSGTYSHVFIPNDPIYAELNEDLSGNVFDEGRSVVQEKDLL